MRVWSWRQIGLGILIALLPPMVYLALAGLVGSGIIAEPTGLMGEVLDDLGLNATIGVILAGIGVSTVGRGAKLTSPWAWLALFVVAVLVIAYVWFVSYATYGGATGSPF